MNERVVAGVQQFHKNLASFFFENFSCEVVEVPRTVGDHYGAQPECLHVKLSLRSRGAMRRRQSRFDRKRRGRGATELWCRRTSSISEVKIHGWRCFLLGFIGEVRTNARACRKWLIVTLDRVAECRSCHRYLIFHSLPDVPQTPQVPGFVSPPELSRHSPGDELSPGALQASNGI